MILVIEPDHDIRVAIRKILENRGYMVESAADANDAFLKLQKKRPQIVLLSDQLIRRDEFIRRLQSDTDFKSIRVGIISDPIEEETILNAVKMQ